jgi:hypothetical protein
MYKSLATSILSHPIKGAFFITALCGVGSASITHLILTILGASGDRIILGITIASVCSLVLAWPISFYVMRFQKKLEAANRELDKAQQQVKVLSGLLPICANCKNIRDDEGYWQSIEEYVTDHSQAEFTHSVCPACAKELYPELKLNIK